MIRVIPEGERYQDDRKPRFLMISCADHHNSRQPQIVYHGAYQEPDSHLRNQPAYAILGTRFDI